MVQVDCKWSFVFFVITSNFVYSSVAASIALTNEVSPFLDPSAHRDLLDDNWMESILPYMDSPLMLSKSAPKIPISAKLSLATLPEGINRWPGIRPLGKYALMEDDSDSMPLVQSQAAVAPIKRNNAGYMCHFKLCQLGTAVSASGKRRFVSY